jgi:hypothetical protein
MNEYWKLVIWAVVVWELFARRPFWWSLKKSFKWTTDKLLGPEL